MSELCHYKVSCPHCYAETILMSYEVNPIIYLCSSCNRFVIMTGSVAYTVSKKFFMNEIFNICKTMPCGRIMSTVKRPGKKRKRDGITTKDIALLHDLLSKNVDSNDIINNL